MVNGAAPGPAPVAQARASNSRVTRSSWRTWPQRKLRRNVPRVDGALTRSRGRWPSRPRANASASSMQSPPASAEAIRVSSLSPAFARPGAAPRSRWASTSCCRPRCWASVAGSSSPALATRRSSSKAFQAGRGCAMIASNRVLPVPGRWAVHTPSSQLQRGTCLRVPAAESGRGFGGSGLKRRQRGEAGPGALRLRAVPAVCALARAGSAVLDLVGQELGVAAMADEPHREAVVLHHLGPAPARDQRVVGAGGRVGMFPDGRSSPRRRSRRPISSPDPARDVPRARCRVAPSRRPGELAAR